MKLSETLAATLSLVFFTCASLPATAQDSSAGPIGRFMERIRSNHAAPHVHTPTHAHAHAAPVPAAAAEAQAVAYQYVDESGAPVQVQVEAEPVAGGDPYGFIGVMNRIRASAGLRPVSYDSNLSSWARRNNAAQCAMGLGHHVNPAAVQNCAWNYANADEAAAGWMNSPGHRENMLSPSITRVGIAFGPGPYWTLNAR